MMRNHLLLFLVSILIFGCKNPIHKESEKITPVATNSKPTVSFTFDDGVTHAIAGFKFEEWNEMLLSHLENENLKAVFFVTGKNKRDEKGHFLLKSWNDKGHKIANHSFTHPFYNSDKNTTHIFENELLRTDSIISKFSNSVKLFRFPYLKEGENKLKIDSIRNVLAENNYSNGYVTIDASDWYVNQRLIDRIKEKGFEKKEVDEFKDFYLQHIMERANYYENLSFEMNHKHINHTLLLHHNLTSALFLGDLIEKFKEEGWDVLNADEAYQDDIFKNIPDSNFAGESLIWSLAKQSGAYENLLRYPAEDGEYEKEKMNSLGL
ncbi:MAG: polysaccharide deacetylase family protein [Maribacter sp.]